MRKKVSWCHRCHTPPRPDRGLALMVTLSLLGLMALLGLLMVLYLSSNMMINGPNKSPGGSFYAADAGLKIARQAMVDDVATDLPSTVTAGTPPLHSGEGRNIRGAILSTYGRDFVALSHSQVGHPWEESFKISAVNVSCISGCASPVVTSRDGLGNPMGYRYVFKYAITSTGKAPGFEPAAASEDGSFTLEAALAPEAGRVLIPAKASSLSRKEGNRYTTRLQRVSWESAPR